MQLIGRSVSAELRCSPWTLSQAVDPIGSAGRYDAFVLVEHPTPWPTDVATLPALAPIVAGPRVRLQAVVPTGATDRGRVGFTVWTRSTSNRFAGVDYQVDEVEVAAAVDEAVLDPEAASRWAVAAAPPEIVICTHGKRDVCCGGLGTRMHAEVEHRWPGVRVRRTSHTGGHRFAPTAYTFPDGRGWAYVDPGVLDQVVARTGPITDLRRNQRGSTAVDELVQPLERAVFEAVGWRWLGCDITAVQVGGRGDSIEGGAADVVLEWIEPDGSFGRADGAVTVARSVPVLVCGSPPELATKTSAELAISDIRIVYK